MGLEDTFDFDGSAYRRKLEHEPPNELRKREIVKLRQTYTASYAIGASIPLTIAFGWGIFAGALAARRFKVASKKLELVEAELRRRNIVLYTPRKRDWFIPMVVCVLTGTLGLGLEHLCFDSTALPTATGVTESGPSLVDSAVDAATNDPAGFADAMEAGAHEQVEELLNAGGDQAATAAMDVALIQAGETGVNTAAFAMGMLAAQFTEKLFLQEAASKLTFLFVDEQGHQSQVWTSAHLDNCTREKLLGRTIPCDLCKHKIDLEKEPWYHCCHCKSDNFDMCGRCLVSLGCGCESRDEHKLYRVAPKVMRKKPVGR